MITIDQSRCIGCGQCVDVCPFTVLKMNEEKKAECTTKPCMRCMHCAIICPAGAITYDGENVVGEAVKELPENIPEIIETMIKQRRSYRKFEPVKVPEEEVKEILTTASFVASAKNTHPTKWLVLNDEKVVDELNHLIEVYLRENQVSPEILVEFENQNNPLVGEHASILIGYCRDDALNPIHDTAIALTSIELMMQSRGIGTCWGGYLRRYININPACREYIDLKEGESVFGALMFGYPKQAKYQHLPKRLDPVNVRFNREGLK